MTSDIHATVAAVAELPEPPTISSMKTIITIASLILAGCAAPVTTVSTSAAVRPATEQQVAQCAYLDSLMGTSMWYGMFASQGAENARAELLLKAEKIGATHVVWGEARTQFGGSQASGKAYRCGS